MTMYQNQSKKVVKVRYRYYGIRIEPYIRINRTSQSMTMKKEHTG
jgi:hypothetical protein